MDWELLIEIGGWIGTAALLLAYGLVSTRRLAGDSVALSGIEPRRRDAGAGQFLLPRGDAVGGGQCVLGGDRPLRPEPGLSGKNDPGRLRVMPV